MKIVSYLLKSTKWIEFLIKKKVIFLSQSFSYMLNVELQLPVCCSQTPAEVELVEGFMRGVMSEDKAHRGLLLCFRW